MKKSFIILMSIAGFSSMQASNEYTSNLTRALRSASLTDATDAELGFPGSPRNRTQSAFLAIETGSLTDAADLMTDLGKDGKLSPAKMAEFVRAVQASPNPTQQDLQNFVTAYNLNNRILSPAYQFLKAQSEVPTITDLERDSLQARMYRYLNK